MNRPLRFTLISASVLFALAVLAPAAFAGAFTYYTSPTGSGTTCSQALPCGLEFAAEEAVNEDVVVVGPGTYALTSALGILASIEFGGQAGVPAPVITTTASHDVYVGNGLKPYVHDLRIEGTGGLVSNAATVERVFVADSGTGEACSLSVGGSLLDSVCWGSGNGNGSAIVPSASGEDGTVTLRNVTALATNAGGDAIHARTNASGDKLLVEGTNVIARAAHHPDVEDDLGGGGLPVIEVKLANSNFATVSGELPPFGTITAPGTNGNQTAAPQFVNAAIGDFREATGSPTIEAGLNEAANGTMGLAGEARVLGTCVGGPGVTDIGAYEFVPTAACASPLAVSSPPPTSSAPPSSPPSNKFTLGKLKLNAKKGTATLVVKLPDAGKFTLSGKGVKKVTRSAKGKASLTLPIKPVGKAKTGLTKTGKAKLSLKLKFAPTGGSAARRTKTVKLAETVH